MNNDVPDRNSDETASPDESVENAVKWFQFVGFLLILFSGFLLVRLFGFLSERCASIRKLPGRFLHNISGKRLAITFLLTFIFISALYLRGYGYLWGPRENSWTHPDEWAIGLAMGRIDLEQGKYNPHFFAYGTFPMYMYEGVQVAAKNISRKYRWLGRYLSTGNEHVGRSVTCIFGFLTVFLTYMLGARMFGLSTGILAASFLALTVLHIQLSHFMTIDVILVFFMTLALYFSYNIAKRGRFRDYVGFALAFGMGMGTKINTVFVLPVFVIAALIHARRRLKEREKPKSSRSGWAWVVFVGLILGSAAYVVPKIPQTEIFLDKTCHEFHSGIRHPGDFHRAVNSFKDLQYVAGASIGLYGRWLKESAGFEALQFAFLFLLVVILKPVSIRIIRWFGPMTATLFLGLGVFFVCMPYAWIGMEEFLTHSLREAQYVKGIGIPPYMNQYYGTPPFLYQLENMVLYCFGPLLGIFLCAAFLYKLYEFARFRRLPDFTLLFWIIVYFGFTGSFHTKFIRHSLPMYPFLCVMGASVLVHIYRRAKGRTGRTFAVTVGGLVLAGTIIYALAFMNIYRYPHTYHQASRWILENIPPYAKIVKTHWEDRELPMGVRGLPMINFESRKNAIYDWERQGRLKQVATNLAWADYLFLNTKRLYGSTLRATHKYPMTGDYYRMLFAERLGYKLTKAFTSYPHLCGYQYIDDLADESFLVYDHPKVLIFSNEDRLDADEIWRRITHPDEDVLKNYSYNKLVLARPGGAGPGLMLGSLFNFSSIPEEKKQELGRFNRKRKQQLMKRKTGAAMNMFEGGHGEAPGQFKEPRDVIVDGKGRVLVVDFHNYRIQVFGKDGRFKSQWGGKGKEFGEFNDPEAIALGPDNRIYIADTWNQRIQIYDEELKAADEIKAGFFAPHDMDFDSQGNMYIADTGNSRVVALNPQGNTILTFGSRGDGPEQMVDPIGLTVDGRDRVYVADCGNHRIQVFDNKGTHLRSWPIPDIPSEAATIFMYIISDEHDRIYLSDRHNNRIVQFDSDGNVLRIYPEVKRVSALNHPSGMAFTAEGDLLVVDSGNSRLFKIDKSYFNPIN